MSIKNSTTQIKAIKALLSPEDIRKAKEIADKKGMKLQAFYGLAIRNATQEAVSGSRN